MKSFEPFEPNDRRCRLLLQCPDGTMGATESLDSEQGADDRRNLPRVNIPLDYFYTRYRDREMEDPRLQRLWRDSGALPAPDDTASYNPRYVTTPSPLPNGTAVVDPVTIYSIPVITHQAASHIPTIEEAYHSQRSGLASGDIGGIITGTVSPKIKAFPGGEERVRTVNGIRGTVSNLIPFTSALDVTADLIDAYNDGVIQDAYDLYEWAVNYLGLVPAEALKFAGVAAAALIGTDAIGFTDYVVPYISPNYPVYDMIDSLIRASDPERKPFHGVRDTMVPIEREMYREIFGLPSDSPASPLVQEMSSISYNPDDDPITIAKDVLDQVIENVNDTAYSDSPNSVQLYDQYVPSEVSDDYNRVYDAGRGNSIITDVALTIPDAPNLTEVVTDLGSTVDDYIDEVFDFADSVVETAVDYVDTYIVEPITQQVEEVSQFVDTVVDTAVDFVDTNIVSPIRGFFDWLGW